MLYVDIPTQQDIKALNRRRSDACVSIYLPTTPLTQEVGISHTELRKLSKQAFAQLAEARFDKRRLAMMQEAMDHLLEDDDFWRLQANSLAVLLTPEDIRTFRLANKLQACLEVSDRFHLKPLLRAVAFPHTAYVLAVSENAVRFIEMTADGEPQEIKVPGLPRDAASAVNKGSEGQKVRLAQYARVVDASIRPILAGLDVPLILVASEPLASIYRSVNSYPGLLPEGVLNTDDRATNGDLAAAARPVLDRLYATELESVRQTYGARAGAGRAYADLSDVARAATFGAVDTLLVDIDASVPGTIDETSGLLALARGAGPSSYDVLDEIAGRTITAGGRVLAVRSSDIPGGGPTAAILRYGV
jgi:hypothetical protein